MPEHSGYHKDTKGGTPGIVSKGRGMQTSHLHFHSLDNFEVIFECRRAFALL